jgi:hypothetical protein
MALITHSSFTSMILTDTTVATLASIIRNIEYRSGLHSNYQTVEARHNALRLNNLLYELRHHVLLGVAADHQ